MRSSPNFKLQIVKKTFDCPKCVRKITMLVAAEKVSVFCDQCRGVALVAGAVTQTPKITGSSKLPLSKNRSRLIFSDKKKESSKLLQAPSDNEIAASIRSRLVHSR